MKKFEQIFLSLLLCFLLTGCTSIGDENPYASQLKNIKITLNYPAGYENMVREGVEVTAKEISNGNTYHAITDERGVAVFKLPQGNYRVTLLDMVNSDTKFNGVIESIQTGNKKTDFMMPMIYLEPSKLIMKELYFGGCPKTPLEGSLINDQYVIIHNNDKKVQYLDGICFGSSFPYTSASSQNTWVEKDPDGNLIFQDFVPIIESIWQFGGNGEDFPLQPGEDAVLVLKGAVDYSKEFPLSVNLNNKDYFVCHSRLHYTNEKQHITPGDQIQKDHILKCLKKVGRANAFVVAIQSPAIVIFRPEKGFDLNAFLADDTRCLATVPGGVEKCLKIPWSWILDGVEVFYSIKNSKRLKPEIDADPIFFSAPKMGRSLHRNLDEAKTQEAGFEIYSDTNNSKQDFHERTSPSLHK